MTLNIISDLHCELNRDGTVDWLDFDPTKLASADYLIVAGDTGYAATEDKIYEELNRLVKGKFKKILTIKGNHSYWELSDKLKDKMAENNYIDVVDGRVAIIGTTLWTSRITRNEIKYMNDYAFIPDLQNEKLRRFAEESAWLREKYNKYKSEGKRIVIVTHHNPRSEAILPEESLEHYDVMSAYWVLDRSLDDIKPDIWICGHVHSILDVSYDGTRFIRHPIGYRYSTYYDPKTDWVRHGRENWYNFTVDI